MSKIKAGDWVRATCRENVIVGKVVGVHAHDLLIDLIGVNARFYLVRFVWSIKVIAPLIPDVVGTIVRDKAGDVWQRREKGWYIADDDADFYDINCLDQDSYAPFTVLYAPENPS